MLNKLQLPFKEPREAHTKTQLYNVGLPEDGDEAANRVAEVLKQYSTGVEPAPKSFKALVDSILVLHPGMKGDPKARSNQELEES